jgi:hypothetical protein
MSWEEQTCKGGQEALLLEAQRRLSSAPLGQCLLRPAQGEITVKIVRSFGVLSFGKFLGILYAMLGAVIGVLYGGIMMIMGLAGGSGGGENAGMFRAVGVGGGLAMIIIAPILYGLLGFIFGLIGTALANLALKFAGGLEIEMDD